MFTSGVTNTALTAMFMTLVLSIVVPIAAAIAITKRWKNVFGVVVAGAMTFFITQMVLRIPLLQLLLPRFGWYKAFSARPVAFLVFLSFSAALFEETGRFLAFRLLLKDRLAYQSGVAFGIGHGGIEAILLVGATYMNNIVFSFILNAGKLETFLEGKLDPATVAYIGKALETTAPGSFLAAGVERVLTMAFQIALSVLILEGLVRGHACSFYLGALCAHGGVNMLVSLVLRATGSIWLTELLMTIVALLSLFYIFRARKNFGDKLVAEDEARQAIEEGY